MEVRFQEANCASSDVTLQERDYFFSEEQQEIEAAQAMCRACPVRILCLEGAVARGEPIGIWGGHLFDRGQVLAEKRPRGRPSRDFQRRQLEVERELVELGIA